MTPIEGISIYMLPYVKIRRPSSGVVIETRKPDVKPEDSDDSGLQAAMSDFADALDSRDTKAMASAFRAAFDMLEMQPHDEVSHEESEE